MGSRDGEGPQEGGEAAAENQDDGDSDSRDAEYMYNTEDYGGRDAGWWRRWHMRMAWDNQVDDESGIRHAG